MLLSRAAILCSITESLSCVVCTISLSSLYTYVRSYLFNHRYLQARLIPTLTYVGRVTLKKSYQFSRDSNFSFFQNLKKKKSQSFPISSNFSRSISSFRLIPGCRFVSGRNATLVEDSCLKCQCARGALTCIKRACPVLACPTTFMEWRPGQCCPQCTGEESSMV